MISTSAARKIVVEHFPLFTCKKTYNEPRQTGGHIIKFYRARNVYYDGAAWRRMLDNLRAHEVRDIELVPNHHTGGHDLLMTV